MRGTASEGWQRSQRGRGTRSSPRAGRMHGKVSAISGVAWLPTGGQNPSVLAAFVWEKSLDILNLQVFIPNFGHGQEIPGTLALSRQRRELERSENKPSIKISGCSPGRALLPS